MTTRSVDVTIVGDTTKLAVDPAPFPGKLKVGSTGAAVVAVQQALEGFGVKRHKTHPHEVGLRLYAPTGHFRTPTAMQCGHAQQVFGLAKTNTYGEGLHRHLAPYFDEHSRALLTRIDHERRLDVFHAELAKIARATCGYMLDTTQRPGWRYEMNSLRMSILRLGLNIETVDDATEDCTSYGGTMITIAGRRAGLADAPWVAGLEFWTGSMINHGRPIALADIRIGDRVHYGNNSHLGVYMGRTQGIASVASFGGEPGPLPRRLSYRGIYAIRRDHE
jgi:hypothetical protein